MEINLPGRSRDEIEKRLGVDFTEAVCVVGAPAGTRAECFVSPGAVSHVISPSRVFDLASVSKIVTATLILRLADEGRLFLDAPLKRALDGVPLSTHTASRFEKLTITRLLSHSSGIASWFPFYSRREESFWDVLEVVLETTPVEEGAVYSDLNFMILGKIIEHATGRTLGQNVEELNAALGSRFRYNPADKANCAPTEYGNRIETRMCAERGIAFDSFRDPSKAIQGDVDDGNSYYFFGGVAGHAGLFGTADDLLRLGGAYLRNGRGGGYLKPETASLSMREHAQGRGLGWQLGEMYPAGAGHTGFTGTSLYVCPEKGLVAALLTNRLNFADLDPDNPPNLAPLRRAVHEAVYEAF